MARESITLTLTLAEARALKGVLKNHLQYGWIASSGEFGVISEGYPSLKAGVVLEKLLEAMRDGFAGSDGSTGHDGNRNG